MCHNASKLTGKAAVLTMCLFASVMGDVAATSAHAQTELRWKFEKGQVLRYEFSQNTVAKVTMQGQSSDNTNVLTIGLAWRVDDVSPDGTAKIAQSIEYVRVDIKAGPQTLTYDSKEGKVEGIGSLTLKELYEKVIAVSTELTIDRDGAILDVRIPRSVSDAVQASQYATLADGGSVFSSEGVKRMLAQVVPRLPGEAVVKGATWDSTLELPTVTLLLKLSTRYSLLGVEDSNALIGSTIDTDVQAAKGVQLEVALKSQTGNGDYRFDPRSGRLVSSTVHQKIDMTLGAMDRQFQQLVELTARLRLRDGSP